MLFSHKNGHLAGHPCLCRGLACCASICLRWKMHYSARKEVQTEYFRDLVRLTIARHIFSCHGVLFLSCHSALQARSPSFPAVPPLPSYIFPHHSYPGLLPWFFTINTIHHHHSFTITHYHQHHHRYKSTISNFHRHCLFLMTTITTPPPRQSLCHTLPTTTSAAAAAASRHHGASTRSSSHSREIFVCDSLVYTQCEELHRESDSRSPPRPIAFIVLTWTNHTPSVLERMIELPNDAVLISTVFEGRIKPVSVRFTQEGFLSY